MPHQQTGITFDLTDTYLLISSYMLQMIFFSLLLGLSGLCTTVLFPNPMLGQKASRVSPEPNRIHITSSRNELVDGQLPL